MNLTTNCITDNDLLILAESCKKIRSISTKKGENRRDYIKLFEDYHALYTKLVELRKYLYSEQKDPELKKTTFSTTFVKELRTRQEKLGITKYLLNDVKFAFIVNIIHWLQNPELLDKKREYKPRTGGKNKVGKDNGQYITMLSMTENKVIFEVKLRKKDPFRKIKIKINNERAIAIHLPELKDNKISFNLNLEFE